MVISTKRKRRSIQGNYDIKSKVKVFAGLNPYSLSPIYVNHEKDITAR